MKTIGIVAEYNPFHNGHAWQIERLRQQTGADYVVAAMSGDFTQRGAPAVTDKYTRARMALSCGVDMVFELPVLWATSSAEDFAAAGVALFEKLGFVDGICFGAETDDLPLLSAVADVLAEEPECFRMQLSTALRQGLSFPSARAAALCGCLAAGSALQGVDDASLTAVLNGPNNILALEYLKALRRRRSSLTPILLPRTGGAYHDTRYDVPFASAQGIRRLLRDTAGDGLVSSRSDGGSPSAGQLLTALSLLMPETAAELLLETTGKAPFVYTDDFSGILGYLLLARGTNGFADVLDSGEELSNRIKKSLPDYEGFSRFCNRIKSRNVTYTRVSRVFLHLLLGLSSRDAAVGKRLDYIPYLRLLGFREQETKPLFSKYRANASVPLLSKLADAAQSLSVDALSMLRQDIFAADLYEQVRRGKLLRLSAHEPHTPLQTEYEQQIVRL